MTDQADPTSKLEKAQDCISIADWTRNLNPVNTVSQDYGRWLSCAAEFLNCFQLELFQLGSWWGERVPPRQAVRKGAEPGLYRLYEYYKPSKNSLHCANDTRTRQPSPLVHPALDTTTGYWRMLRVVKVGGDGLDHLEILRYVSSLSEDHTNHCLPMLREISIGHITFAVLPYMSADDGSVPGFYNLRETLDYMEQTIEGLCFLHKNRIAHRDIAWENIVWNLAGPCQSPDEQSAECRTPWRSQFPIRYFFIDLELAVRFSSDADPSTMMVTGLPTESFARFCPPECLTDGHYDPFAADIFSLALMYWNLFKQIQRAGYPALLDSMLQVEPSKRLTAVEALSTLREYRESMSSLDLEEINGPVIWKEDVTHPNAGTPPALAKYLLLLASSTPLD